MWRRTARRAEAWRTVLGGSEYVERAVRFGIRDMPIRPFVEGLVMKEIPQSMEDREYAQGDLERGVAEGVYERVGEEEVEDLVREGKMVSSAFVVWQGHGEERKGRFVVNFHRQSKHWARGSVKMETVQSFALDMEKNDVLMSWDFKSGYRHFYLHPDVRNFFVFRYGGAFYRCIALPFGWGRSVLWFMKLLRPLVQFMREKLKYRVLPYIDDFLVAPSPPGRAATKGDCKKAGRVLEVLFERLGLCRHPEKGVWGDRGSWNIWGCGWTRRR